MFLRWFRIINAASNLVDVASSVGSDRKLKKAEMEKIVEAAFKVIDAYEGRK